MNALAAIADLEAGTGATPAPADHPEFQYLGLLKDILQNGVERGDRTGTGTLGVFGRQMRFDLSKGFPLLTTKKLHLRSIMVELLWFLRGETNIAWLKDNGVSIWDEWADAQGELGPVYGKQWRSWSAPDGRVIDQITRVVESLKTMMMAQVTGLKPGEFVHTFGDAHLYLNHLDQAKLQLTREPRPLPTMTIAPRDDLFAFGREDFVLEGYDPWPHIKAAVAV